MLAQLTLRLVLSLSLAGCSTTEYALVTAGPGPATGLLMPALPPAPSAPLQRSHSAHHRRQQRQLEHDSFFWAARGKRPTSVHYWDLGVPPAAMTSATIRRFLGLPSKREQEREERQRAGADEERAGADEERARANEERALPAVSEHHSSERGKKDFWASRGKKGGDGDFWASRGKKDGDGDFWASRGKRGSLARALGADRVYAVSLLSTSRQEFWSSRGK